MSNLDNEPEVKIIERHEVAPAGGDNVDEEIETPTDSSQEKNENDEVEEEVEETDEKEPTKIEGSEEEDDSSESDESDENEPEKVALGDNDVKIKRIPGESPREYALRLDNARLKTKLRKEQTDEILGNTPSPTSPKKELAPEKKKVLDKYKKEDLDTLKEVFDVMAEDMGFVRQEQLNKNSFQEKASETLDNFLEKHPEYLPQNDKDNLLWNRFKEEYGLYRPAQTVKELNKILNKVHREVFGIKPATALDKNVAAKEKIKVASHGSSSKPSPSREGVKRSTTPTAGLRTDMLKGFSDDEIAELTGE